MKKASILLIIATIASKLIGFIRDKILASLYGIGPVATAFSHAYSLPSQFFSVVVAAFVTGFIPMFTRIEEAEGTEKANDFSSNILNVMLSIAGVVSLFIFLFAGPVTKMMLPSLDAESMSYVVPFLRVSIFSLLFTCVVQLMTGFLQIRQAYVFPMLMGFPLNFVLIGALYLSKLQGSQVLPFGIVLAYVLQAGLILWYAKKRGFKHRLVLDFKDKHMLKMLVIALPLIIGSASVTIGSLINNAIISGHQGALALLNYNYRVGNIVDSIFSISIISVTYPAIAKAIAKGEKNQAQKEFWKSLVSILLFTVPSAVGLFILSKPVVQFIYMKGEFTMDNVLQLAPILRNYSIAIIFIGLYTLCVRMFYSHQDMKTPMFFSIGVIVVQVILNLLLIPFFGVPAVTLAVAISYALASALIIWRMKLLFGEFRAKKYVRQIIKIFIAALVMGVVTHFGYSALAARFSNTIALLATLVLAMIVYGIAVLALRIETVSELLDTIKNRKHSHE